MAARIEIRGVLYRSRALRDASADGDIYIPARVKNRALGISGFLHRQDGHYFQFLEGDPQPIERLLKTIADDPRHDRFEVLLDHAVPRRFSGTPMGYTQEEDMDWAGWVRDRGGPATMRDADPDEIIAFLAAYGDPAFAEDGRRRVR